MKKQVRKKDKTSIDIFQIKIVSLYGNRKRKELEKWQQRERINQVREKIKIHMVSEPAWQLRVAVRYYLDVVQRVERYYLLNKVSQETFLL